MKEDNIRSKIKSAGQFRYENRKSWRGWLRDNHAAKGEVWVILPKKSAGGDGYKVFYEEAVEEALCYGWVDNLGRSLDEKHTLIRFGPRKNRMAWSPSNIERATRLIQTGRMTRAGLEVLSDDLAALANQHKTKK